LHNLKGKKYIYKPSSYYFFIKTNYIAKGRQLRRQLKTYNITISKNNIIDVLNNHIRAADTIIKYLSCLIGNKAILNIWYRTTRFRNKYTNS
jgi:hypothetical protein